MLNNTCHLSVMCLSTELFPQENFLGFLEIIPGLGSRSPPLSVLSLNRFPVCVLLDIRPRKDEETSQEFLEYLSPGQMLNWTSRMKSSGGVTPEGSKRKLETYTSSPNFNIPFVICPIFPRFFLEIKPEACFERRCFKIRSSACLPL